MRKEMWAVLAVATVVVASIAFAQTRKQTAVYITAEEIKKVENGNPCCDHEIKITDMGAYNLGVAVVRHDAVKPGGVKGINHTKVAEVYYMISGEGTMITGGDSSVKDLKPLVPSDERFSIVVGPGNDATFVKPSEFRKVKAGDVIIIPPGMYHGWSEIPDHVEYVTVRPDPSRVLPAGYVNPVIK